jgi:uncharacterized sporulation protein YeaH/YhbH (DUF444 family)
MLNKTLSGIAFMEPVLFNYYQKLKKAGLSQDREQKILRELYASADHGAPQESFPQDASGDRESQHRTFRRLYDYHDLFVLQALEISQSGYHTQLRSIDELLERDKQRDKDGFPRKIRVGRLIKPGRGGKEKVVVVPSTVEEKFIHDASFDEQGKGEGEGDSSGGTGDGEEGEVIGEQPVHSPEGASGAGPGEGEEGPHELESNAYDLGKILTEQFELPNLKDKGKKRVLKRYTYDLTDRHRGFGQILDKKATLRRILETNIHLGNLADVAHIDPSRFLISPSDKVYRILSREKDYESQAMVFFVRDYSGSMAGEATQLVVTQHVLIYSWLLYQYEKQVETRFILHDTAANEVKDFYTYYNSKVAGGTQVSSAYQLVNEIVERENLMQDYNIYVFHGTDGDDWDTDGKEAIPALKQMLSYASRVGVTIAEHTTGSKNSTEVERYLKKSGLLETQKDLLRMDVMAANAEESRVIEGIRTLIS